MAETSRSIEEIDKAVNEVINKQMIPLYRDEVRLQRRVPRTIVYHRDMINAFLKYVDKEAQVTDTNDLVKGWVTQVRNLSYCIQDVIDERSFKMAKRNRQNSGLIAAARRISHLVRTIITYDENEQLSQLGYLTQSVRFSQTIKIMCSIESAIKYLSSRDGADVDTRRDIQQYPPPFVEDTELVGVDKTKEKLMDWLLNGEKRRTILSVVGEAGLGKTAIANNLYEKQKEEWSFDCYAWITVSRSLKGEKLLKAMVQSLYVYDYSTFDEYDCNMDMVVLIRKLRKFLCRRRYIIVFDDVRDLDFWEIAQFALPDYNNGSRVIITARDKRVAEYCRRFAPYYIYELPPLYQKHALELFYLKVFQFDDLKTCPQQLLGLSKDFVRKCNGVPLAIVSVANFLSTAKKDVSEWKMAFNSIHSKWVSDSHLRPYHQVLLESYNDLSFHLKLCLLYFGLFPKDHHIRCARLINLWIADDLVLQEGRNMTLEEVAEEYLDELIRKGLVKILDVYPYGRVRSCRVHDLMHDFILKRCEEMNFCQVKKSEEFQFHALTRRLSIQAMNPNDLQCTRSYDRVRSCIVFSLARLPDAAFESMLSGFKLLIGLDLEGSSIGYLPKAVGNLLLLKYLSLRGTMTKTIPSFIKKLQNLEYLDLKYTHIQELPAEINKLVKLGCLITNYLEHGTNHLYSFRGAKLQEGIGCLWTLKKLSSIDATDGDAVITELKSLRHMRKFSITGLRRHQTKFLCPSIENMEKLRSLSIRGAEHEVIDLESLTNPPRYLRRLYLDVHIEKLPNWPVKLEYLVKLRLSFSGLMEDPLPILKDLSELVELQLVESYEGEELHFRDGWFKWLKSLDLEGLKGLKTLTIDKGALPVLQTLQLRNCPQLVEVPNGCYERMKQMNLVTSQEA